MSFASLGLDNALVAAVNKAGYTEPTPVQAAAIPAALAGQDLMVSAATGSGKTAAFMLPALQRLNTAPDKTSIGPRVLVLAPTRELAQQVAKAGETYGRALRRLSVVTVVGGMPYPVQIKMLRQPVDILVATPGRLLDYIGRGRIDFSRCEILVFDEADRMLDMGFKEDIEQIVAALPAKRQTLMFSATFGGPVGRMAEAMMREPQRLELDTHQDKHADIEQRVHYADNAGHKEKLLDHLLRDVSLEQAIVFAATKRDAESLTESLGEKGFSAAALHGDMPQAKRNRTLQNLRRGNIRVLVATDVAARGIDVPTISHVINFGMPMKAEDYVHRIGRTGRAGRAGIAITLLTGAERGKLRAIERFTAQQIPVHTIAGLEPSARIEQRERRPRFSRDGAPGPHRGSDGQRSRDGYPRRDDAAPRRFADAARSDARGTRTWDARSGEVRTSPAPAATPARHAGDDTRKPRFGEARTEARTHRSDTRSGPSTQRNAPARAGSAAPSRRRRDA